MELHHSWIRGGTLLDGVTRVGFANRCVFSASNSCIFLLFSRFASHSCLPCSICESLQVALKLPSLLGAVLLCFRSNIEFQAKWAKLVFLFITVIGLQSSCLDIVHPEVLGCSKILLLKMNSDNNLIIRKRKI